MQVLVQKSSVSQWWTAEKSKKYPFSPSTSTLSAYLCPSNCLHICALRIVNCSRDDFFPAHSLHYALFNGRVNFYLRIMYECMYACVEKNTDELCKTWSPNVSTNVKKSNIRASPSPIGGCDVAFTLQRRWAEPADQSPVEGP